MAGIYFHVPFCFSRCGYCDFFKSVNLEGKHRFLSVLLDEIRFRKEEFLYPISTIYFGGGTPSLIESKFLNEFLVLLRDLYDVSKDAEITIEVNPDDASFEYLSELRQIGFNRISIGTQSFFDEDLKQMGRRHNAAQSQNSVLDAQRAGFLNISVDLIYGLPWSNVNNFSDNLQFLDSLPIHHLSAYHLTFEKGTSFYKSLKAGKYRELNDEESISQYKILCQKAKEMGFEHYEVSNFCKPGFVSKHNSAYWQGTPYIGFGPGSHSFYNDNRRWNKPDIDLYNNGNFELIYDDETLTKVDAFNEKFLLGLRTKQGVNLIELANDYAPLFNSVINFKDKWINCGALFEEEGFLKCTEESWFIVDAIIEDFIIVD